MGATSTAKAGWVNPWKALRTSLLHCMGKVIRTVNEGRIEVNSVYFLGDYRDTGLSVNVKLPLLLVQWSGKLRTFREELGEGGVNSSSNSICLQLRAEAPLNPSACRGSLHSYKAIKADLALLGHDKGLEESCITGGVDKGRGSFCVTSKKQWFSHQMERTHKPKEGAMRHIFIKVTTTCESSGHHPKLAAEGTLRSRSQLRVAFVTPPPRPGVTGIPLHHFPPRTSIFPAFSLTFFVCLFVCFVEN